VLRIQQVTIDPLQKQVLVLDDGTTVSLELYFRPRQLGWFINELVYGNFILRGVRVTNSPNILNQWRHLIPFGLSCFSADNREPSLLEDFSSSASKLYILTQAEVAEYAEFLSAG
jgi:hypothetical protein